MTYLSQNGKERFAEYAEMLREFRHRASAWQSLKLWEHPAKEPSKLVIGTGSELTGPELSGILREKYGFAVEMEAAGYILAMTSLADERSAIIRFAEALTEIDAVLTKKRQADTGDAQGTRHDSGTQGTHPDDDAQRSWQEPQVCMDAYDAVNQPYEEVVFLESVNRISAEYVMVYPPGIPFLVPGERVTEEAVRKMTAAKEKNLPLLGLADKKTEKIRVIKKRGLDSPMLSD
jgi:arginine/lysine/ornithine decarboxylase